MKSVSVKKIAPTVRIKSNGKIKCPPKIPQGRSNKWKWPNAVLSMFLIAGSCWFRDEETPFLFVGTTTCLCIVTLTMAEAIKRGCHLYEELDYLISRYDNNVSKLLYSVFCAEARLLLIFAICLAILLSVKISPLRISSDWEVIGFILNLVGVYLLSPVLLLNDSQLYDSIRITDVKGLDYGSGMAHSYFHGYLNIMLPHRGCADKGLKEQMMDYEARNSIRFESYKLYILIPLSLYCPPSLESPYSPSISVAAELSANKRHRAGTMNRVYKNSVYKIQTGRTYKYVCAEYASPCKTLEEVINNNSDHSRLYGLHKKEIIWNFYVTLQNNIKEASVCDLCELIYFDDVDYDNERYDVGEIIIQRLAADKKKLMKAQK